MTSFTDTTRSSDIHAVNSTARANQSRPTSTLGVQGDGTTSLLEKLYRGATSPIRLLPDFLIIGTQRGGTTSLFHYLETHPCIKAANIKDTHFFDKKYGKGLAWYRGHFPTFLEKTYAHRVLNHAFVTGEASASYLFHPHTPKRVAQVLPHVKLIVLLRNPVDRAYSQYYHAIELGHETLSFEEAIQSEEERTRQERAKILKDERYYSHAYKHLSYLSRGGYVEQLQVWMNLFPREQFLVLKSEDFYADPAAILKEVMSFLNVPVAESHLRKKEYKQYNNNSYSKMDAAMRTRLVEYFKPHNARLYDYLSVDFGWDK
jgi:Sulfotransferase domain